MVTRAQRDANVAKLHSMGYTIAPDLPLERSIGPLRPAREIALRLCGMDAVFTWVLQSETDAPEARLKAYAERSKLVEGMTEKEKIVFESPRSEAALQRDLIRWNMENECALAWALGFEDAPTVDGQRVTDATVHKLLLQFMPKLSEGIEELLAKAKPRSEEEIAIMEDLFYCALTAVKAAHNGESTVPTGFDTRHDGGVIHERRHALTYCLSPGTDWKAVDVSS
jgi:hypothetical protein